MMSQEKVEGVAHGIMMLVEHVGFESEHDRALVAGMLSSCAWMLGDESPVAKQAKQASEALYMPRAEE